MGQYSALASQRGRKAPQLGDSDYEMKLVRLAPAFVVCVGILVAAQAVGTGGTAEVSVADHETVGTYLVDADGVSLYLFLSDEQSESTCYDECAENWPPLLVDKELTAGEGIDAPLLGTRDRADGTTQATYNGWPLYYFAEDAEPGDIAGQAMGDVWYLVAPDGKAHGATEEAGDMVDFEALMEQGRAEYEALCAVCHDSRGRGTALAPPLAGDRGLANATAVIRQVVQGGREMPPFGDHLSDEELAAVVTYIRNSWGNDFGPVTVEEVR